MIQRTELFVVMHCITSNLIFINVHKKVIFKIILNNRFYIKRFFSTIEKNLIANLIN